MSLNTRKPWPPDELRQQREKLEQLKASVRAKVEHPFHVLKNLFRHRKTRYRGLAKNTAQLFTLFGLPIWCSLAGDLRCPAAKLRPDRRYA